MGYWFLILVTIILYVRPVESFPVLHGIQFYLMAIVPCLVFSMDRLARQVSGASFSKRPVHVFLFGYYVLVMLASAANGRMEAASDQAGEMGKILLFYLLVNAQTDRPERLRRYLKIVSGVYLLTTVMAVLNYYQIVEIPGFIVLSEWGGVNADTGQVVYTRRLGGPKTIGDPNDFCANLSLAIVFGMYGLTDKRWGWQRFVWLAPLGLFFWAVKLTQSRGGLLAVLLGLGVVLATRLGRRKTLILAVVGLPVVLALVGGRQGGLSTSSGTGQARIQYWISAFAALSHSPVFGRGTGWSVDAFGMMVHNSFLQAFSDTGLVGGLFFFGGFFYVLDNLYRLSQGRLTTVDPEMRRTSSYMLAAMVSYMVAIMTLNHSYSLPTFLMLALGMSTVRQADPTAALPHTRLNGRLIVRTATAGLLFLAALYAYAKLSVRW